MSTDAPTGAGDRWTGTEALVGDIAHELANVLGVVLNYALFVLEAVPAGSAVATDAQEIVDGARRSATLAGQLGLLGRLASCGVELVDVTELATTLRPLLERSLDGRATLAMTIDDDTPDVWIDPSALSRALVAVVGARRDELDAGAVLSLHVASRPEATGLVIDVEGAAPTFDPHRAGGLAMARAAGGDLVVRPAPTGRASLSLAVPLDAR